MGFTTSLSYPLRRSFKRVGITYSLDRSTLLPLSTASKTLFDFIAFRGISGPNAVNGIITSKIFPNFSFNTLDSGISPHHGHQMTLGAEFAGIGGTVRSIRPIVQYKQFIPVQKRRNAIGFSVNGSYISGYGGLVAPPFQRFYMGGENDIRGFDIRSISPVAFLPSANRDHADQSGWHAGSEESGEPAARKLDRADSSRSDRVSRRRSEHVDEPRIPLSPLRARWRSLRSSIPASTRSSRVRSCRSPPASTTRSSAHPSVARHLMRATTVWAGSVLSPVPSQDLQVLSCDELEAAHVDGTRTADVPAGDQRAVPYLLGLQPVAAGQPGESADPDYARMFPAGAAGDYTYHLAVNYLCAEFPVERAAQDFPVYGRDDVLSTFDGPRLRSL